ncbi:MAG: ABC transporter permease [Nitrospirota bacterium]
MRNMGPLIGKELRLYFISPIAYVLAMVFLLITDFLFYLQISAFANMSTRMMQLQQSMPDVTIHQVIFHPAFMNMGIILLLMVPLLTMRLFAEEKKGRTMELLLTSPITLTEIVLSKFLSAFFVYLILLALTLHVPLILSAFITVPIKPLLASYLGLSLMGAVFVAFGVFASTLTENQMIAAVSSFGISIGLWLVGAGDQSAIGGGDGTPLSAVLNFLSLVQHLDNMARGLINTRDIGYFVSMTLLGLFLSHRVVESTRWK